jgi:hypothetical protein
MSLFRVCDSIIIVLRVEDRMRDRGGEREGHVIVWSRRGGAAAAMPKRWRRILVRQGCSGIDHPKVFGRVFERG